MATILLGAIVVLILSGFIGLWLWTRSTERDEIDWEHGAQADDKQKRDAQIKIGITGNGH